MINFFIFLLALLLLGGGCAPLTPSPVPASEPAPSAVAAGALELPPLPVVADQACAYFHFLRGKQAELAGEHQEAGQAYRQALACDPRADHVIRSLAILLLRLNERGEAIAWVKRMIELRPDDTAARSLLANLYSAAGESDKAAAIYLDILADEPDNANVILLLATLYAGQERLAEGRALLEGLTHSHPDFHLAHYYLARLYRDLDDLDSALRSYERALDLHWSPGLAQEVAGAYELAGRYEESLRLYRRMVADDPTDERARGLLANIYLRMNRVDEALAELAELRHYSSDVDSVDLTIARILVDEERFAEAVALLHTLLADEPRLDAVRSLLVLAYYRMGHLGRSRALLEEIRPGDYGYEDAVLMLARIYHGDDDPTTAVKVLARALDDPEHRYLSFYVTLALIHAEWHDAGQGMLVFDRALRELGRTAKVLFEYGIYLQKIGNSEAALARMQEVLELDPHDPYALNFVGYTWADRGENLEQALEYISEAVRLRPEDGAIRDSLGWVYYRLGDYERALAELELAAQLLSYDPEIFDHLGDTYRQLGRLEDAVAAYRQAIELLDPEENPERWQAIHEKLEALDSAK